MSTNTDHAQDNGHGTVKSYIIGFILSLILTISPYILVVNRLLLEINMLVAISCFAIAQLFVQLVFFLHMGQESKPRWNLTAFVFALFAVLVFIFGSLWIMYNLNYNMMAH